MPKKVKFERAWAYAPDVRTHLRFPPGEYVVGEDIDADAARRGIESGACLEIKGGGSNDSGGSLGDMTKAELIAFAEANGIEVNARGKKADILAAVTAA